MRPVKKTNKEVQRRTVERLTVINALNLLRVVSLVSTNRVHFSRFVRWFVINNGKTDVIISVNFNRTYSIITL
jgi:hypothetical protein